MRHSLHVVGILFAVGRAEAQALSTTLDVGASRVRYADSVLASALTVTPGASVNADRGALDAYASYSQLRAGGWTSQGSLRGSAFTPVSNARLGELYGSAGGSAHDDGTRTGELLALLRGHVLTVHRGASLGMGGGRTWDGVAWRNIIEGELGFWSRMGEDVLMNATLRPTIVDDSVRYADSEISAQWTRNRLELAASAGARAGSRSRGTTASASTWGSVNIVAWLTSTLAFTGGVGSYPVDLTQGFPGGRFASLALRMALGRERPPVASAPAGAAPGIATETETARTDDRVIRLVDDFAVGTPAGKAKTLSIRVHAPSARSVEINADFTDWSPVNLVAMPAGWWMVTLPVRGGTHQVNVRADRGSWEVPPTLTVMRDEFGGTVGLLVVP